MTSPGQGFVFDLLFAWIVPALFVISEGIKSSSGFGRVWSITQFSFFSSYRRLLRSHGWDQLKAPSASWPIKSWLTSFRTEWKISPPPKRIHPLFYFTKTKGIMYMRCWPYLVPGGRSLLEVGWPTLASPLWMTTTTLHYVRSCSRASSERHPPGRRECRGAEWRSWRKKAQIGSKHHPISIHNSLKKEMATISSSTFRYIIYFTRKTRTKRRVQEQEPRTNTANVCYGIWALQCSPPKYHWFLCTL